jgi:hypothetical protein
MNPETMKAETEVTLTGAHPSYRTFIFATMAWAVLSLAITLFGTPHEEMNHALRWLVVLFGVSIADLYSIARLVGTVLELIVTAPEKRLPGLIQASYWGILKLACLGIFSVLVFKGHDIPVTALLTGVGTMVFVPLVGGFWWSKGQQQ